MPVAVGGFLIIDQRLGGMRIGMIDTAHLCLTQDGCLRIGLCLWTGEESGVAFPGQSRGPSGRNCPSSTDFKKDRVFYSYPLSPCHPRDNLRR